MFFVINDWTGMGYLTKDPELQYTPTGKPVANFVFRVPRSFTNKEGKRESDFIPVVVWGNRAEACANHLISGSRVIVKGRIQVSHYEGSEGRTIYKTEIVASNVTFVDGLKNTTDEEIQVDDSPAEAIDPNDYM